MSDILEMASLPNKTLQEQKDMLHIIGSSHPVHLPKQNKRNLIS